MEYAFTKMHGLGNDFVIIDGIARPVSLNVDQCRRIADRRRGIGCDQILVLDPGTDGADAACRVYNPDGSEAGQCGNGARCIARYLCESGRGADGRVRIAFKGGLVEAALLGESRVRVGMGVPRFAPGDIPLRADERADSYRVTLAHGDVEFRALSMGNPHAVIVVPDVDAAPVAAIGPQLQQHGIFPEGVNVGFLQLMGRDRVRLRVYERGAGETQACGSGACAAVVAGRLRGDLDDKVEVQLKGGNLVIEWSGGTGPVWMTGPATKVFEGVIEI